MDFISLLPDHLLLRILSFVQTKDVVATSILSKRWRSVWMLVPILDYDELRDQCGDYGIYLQYIERSLLSNNAPVLEKLRLSLYCDYSAIDIGHWIDFAVTRRVRELDIDVHSLREDFVSLPSSLYTSGSLEFLRLAGFFLLDSPTSVCLPSLKHLTLDMVVYIDNAILPQLLSGCPNLEELFVCKHEEDETEDVVVVVPSLKRLTLSDKNYVVAGRYVIDAPGLKYLKITDTVDYEFRRIENMPELVEAEVNITQRVTHKVLRALTSVQHLSLCLSLSEVTRPSRMMFNQLVHLELCTTAESWRDLLTLILHGSPKLQTLILNDNCDYRWYGFETSMDWEQPSSVPECLLSSLEAFEWIGYKGRDGDKMMATYFLKNAACLKTATFSPDLAEKYEMINELASVDAASSQVRVRFYFSELMITDSDD